MVTVGQNHLNHKIVFSDFLLCRQCGHEVAEAVDLITVPSTVADRRRNDTILGVKNVLIQLFTNPHSKQYYRL